MRIVITGGHFSPAYSIIQKLKGDNEILVVGRKFAFEGDVKTTFEYRVCKELGVEFVDLPTGKLQRNVSISSIKSLLKFPAGILRAINILRRFAPDVCLTFGGYIGLPVAAAAKILGIPVVLHEQTQKAGLSAKLISKFASTVLVSFESSKKYFPGKKVILTGNPLRPEFFERKSSMDVKNPSIYITGGSTGSHFLNTTVEKALPDLLKKFHIYHQTGNATEYNDINRLAKIKHPNYIVSEFFSPSEVFGLLRKVDLVISRSGINTVNEIIASKAVSLLVPLPYGQKNEQLDNAEFVKKIGVGDYVLQDNLTEKVLVEKISDMILRSKYYKKNLESECKKILLDSADRIIEVVLNYGKQRRGSEKTERV